MLSVRVCLTQFGAKSLIPRAGINQKDVPERNQQVTLMRSIYTKAERVLGWLGPDDNGGVQALKTLETVLENTIRYPDTFEWARRLPELLTTIKTFTTDSGGEIESNDMLENMFHLLKRPYWKRLWVIQELVLPSKLTLLCGEEFTDIPETDSFNSTVRKLSIVPINRPESVSLPIFMRLSECFARLRLVAELRSQHLHRESRANRIWNGTSGFIRARPFLEFHKATDPRDHVYALLGLIDLDIVPDYGKTVADVYLEVARHCLNIEPLDILSLAGIRKGPDDLTYLDLPSWVPDWRLPPPARTRLARYSQSHAFRSKGGLKMQVIGHKWLRGSAVVWDIVSKTEQKSGWDLTEWDLAERIDIEKTGDWAYPSGISRFQAFIILWLGGYDEIKGGELKLDGELFKSYTMIFFANIAKPWVKKYERQEKTKLGNLIVGRNVPTFVPISHRESYVARSRQLRYGMRCFHTERGYIGLGPLSTEAGDLVCILEGHKSPVLLRRRRSHYTFVGDCDVVGIMNGEVLEAVERGEAEIAEIEIR